MYASVLFLLDPSSSNGCIPSEASTWPWYSNRPLLQPDDATADLSCRMFTGDKLCLRQIIRRVQRTRALQADKHFFEQLCITFGSTLQQKRREGKHAAAYGQS